MLYRHITLFRIRNGTSDAEVDHALHALRRLGSETVEPLEWTAAMSLDSRKGTVLVENSLFESESSFNAWRETAEHRAVVALMSRIADWTVGDYLETGTSQPQ